LPNEIKGCSFPIAKNLLLEVASENLILKPIVEVLLIIDCPFVWHSLPHQHGSVRFVMSCCLERWFYACTRLRAHVGKRDEVNS
jgi:hypothetical protein